jgi:hypothetical protein
MATKTMITLEDDYDGGTADETVRFNLDGASYEIDLSNKNADKLRKALSPFLEAARRTGGRSTTKRGFDLSAGAVDTKAVRAWAASNGVSVSSRGRIPAQIIEQYRAAGH